MLGTEASPLAPSDDVRQQLRSFILENFLDGANSAQLDNSASLERSHIVDSARMMDLILFIEETFGFEVDNEEALPENFDSVNNLVAYVSRKLEKA